MYVIRFEFLPVADTTLLVKLERKQGVSSSTFKECVGQSTVFLSFLSECICYVALHVFI